MIMILLYGVGGEPGEGLIPTELVKKLLANPEMMALLQSLAGQI